MPFYSRHSDDGSDRLLGGIHDEDDYNDFMNVLFMNSSFADDIEGIIKVQMLMCCQVLLIAKKQKKIKRNNIKRIIIKMLSRKT